MVDGNALDYDALRKELEEARQGQQYEKELRRQAEEERRQAEEERRQAEEERRQAEEERRQAEEERRQAEELSRRTTFDEYIAACHALLSQPLRAAHPSRSTKGSIPAPTGKYCPTKLREWTSFPVLQAQVYNIVRRHLQPAELDAPRLFSPILALQEFGRRLCSQPIASEKDLEGVEAVGKEGPVQDIVSALCEIPSARKELRLGVGFRFDSHANALDQESGNASAENTGRMRPDQFCVHRLEDRSSTLLMTAEYKPPHKLSVENMRAGLRSMDFWEEVVSSETVPTEGPDKLRYNAARLMGAALAQEYHVMIQEGLAYSYVSTGTALVFLYVPETDPTTLHYYLCVPNKDVPSEIERYLQQPLTAVARVLCLCLMSCATSVRSNEWRNRVKSVAHIWQIDFDYARSQIPDEQLHETPPGSEYVPSSPIECPHGEVRRHNTRLNTGCSPSPDMDHDLSNPSDSDSSQVPAGRKRNYSQVASSPPQPQPRHSRSSQSREGGQTQHTASTFCTQRCLLGLQQGRALDLACPNVSEHRRGRRTDKHPVTANEMVRLLKQQLDADVDHHCEPLGPCGASGAPFKLRCQSYGYTFVGKGTTSRLWSRLLREANFYQVLRSVQGSAVPVFLGSIDLKLTYFLHGAGEIQHMLLMAWGGKPLTEAQWHDQSTAKRAMKKSYAEIRKLGVRHGDVRPANSLWNSELNRVLLIDFDMSELVNSHAGLLKRKSTLAYDTGTETSQRRRLRAQP